MPITFVAAVNNREILNRNLLASPCFQVSNSHEVILQEGFTSAAKAYNDAIDRSKNDLIVFVHQDIVFATSWIANLESSLKFLDANDPQWGVLGCYGMTQDDRGVGFIRSGTEMLGAALEKPTAVQTLDEIVLIFRKSSGLRFDEGLPSFHLYGTDICMEAGAKGRKAYSIPAFCVHNADQTVILPPAFYQCYRYLRRKWRAYLPIQSTCIRFTKFNHVMYRRRLREVQLKYVTRDLSGAVRELDGRALLDEIENSGILKNAQANPIAHDMDGA